MLLQLCANGIAAGCFYSLLGISYGLIYDTTRTFHISHAGIYTAGAFVGFTLYSQLGVPLLVSLLLAMSFCAFLGVAAEVLIYSPLVRRGAPPLLAFLSSVGLNLILVNLVSLLFGSDSRVMHPGAQVARHFGAIVLTDAQLAEIFLVVSLFPCFLYCVKKTSWGRQLRAVRDAPFMASTLGIDVPSIRRSAFAIGSALAGLAAFLAAVDLGISPQMGMPALLAGAVALIVGGVGTFSGPIVGGFVLGAVQALALWQISARWSDAITFALLVTFLIARPHGLVGRRLRPEEATA